MSLCQICDRQARDRRVRVEGSNGSYRFEIRRICEECEVLLKKKPSSTKRGRRRDRDVPAPSTDQWIAALRRSWSIAKDGFRCEVSGLMLDLRSAHAPLSLSCDHDPPGSANFLVVAWLINDMKNDHDRGEFYTNLARLAEMVQGGLPNAKLADKYRDSFAGLKHWRRASQPTRLPQSAGAAISSSESSESLEAAPWHLA